MHVAGVGKWARFGVLTLVLTLFLSMFADSAEAARRRRRGGKRRGGIARNGGGKRRGQRGRRGGRRNAGLPAGELGNGVGVNNQFNDQLGNFGVGAINPIGNSFGLGVVPVQGFDNLGLSRNGRNCSSLK